MQHGRCCLLIAHAFGNFHKPVRSHSAVLGIAAEHHGVRHPIAYLQVRDIGADGYHLSGCFLAGDERHHRLVASFSVVHIDEVDAGGDDLYDCFRTFGFGHREFHQLKHLRTACTFHLNCFHRKPLDFR